MLTTDARPLADARTSVWRRRARPGGTSNETDQVERPRDQPCCDPGPGDGSASIGAGHVSPRIRLARGISWRSCVC